MSAGGCLRWILAATVLGRLVFLVLFSHTLSLQTSGYDTYAVNLVEGRGYTRFDDRPADSDLPPLYPFFLAVVYVLVGRGPLPVALVQAGLDVLTTWQLYLIGRRLAGERAGLLAAAFYGAYPYLLFQNLTLNDTGLFILLLVTGVRLAYRARDTRDWRRAAALGAVFGLATLTKTLMVLAWPLLAIWWWRQLGPRDAARLSLASGLALLAVLTPWVVRNTRLHGEFVFVSTNGGSNLHQGNNACVVRYLTRGWDAQWVSCLPAAPAVLSETEADRWHRRQAVRYWREHPEAWLSLLRAKLWVLWNPVLMPTGLPPDARLDSPAVLLYQTPAFQAARTLHLFYFGPLLALGALGLILACRDGLPIGPLVVVFVVITVTYVVFHPSTRYRSPADPFVFVLSAYALTRLPQWRRPPTRRHPVRA